MLEKGCKIKAFAQHSWPMCKEEPLSCHTSCDIIGALVVFFAVLSKGLTHFVTLYGKQWELKTYCNPDLHTRKLIIFYLHVKDRLLIRAMIYSVDLLRPCPLS